MSTYTPQSTDTSIAADRLLFRLLSERTNAQRWAMTVQHTQGGLRLSLAGLQARFQNLNQREFAQKVAQVWLGDYWSAGFEPTGDPMTWVQDSIGLAQRLHSIFDQLSVLYYVTGGIASTTYGEPRLTLDLDLVVSVSGVALYPLVAALEADGFYVPGVEDAVSGRMQTLQITDPETIARADLVIARDEEWERVKFARRQRVSGVYFASPEDVILNKLRWGQHTQSEKQWRDVLGVLKVQGDALDFGYLRQWGEQLRIADELGRAIAQAGLTP